MASSHTSPEDSTTLVCPPKQKSSNPNVAELVGIIIASVMIFILAFATASAWVLFAQTWVTLPSKTSLSIPFKSIGACRFYKMLCIALGLLLFTLLVSILFGVLTSKWKAQVPIDVSSMISNVKLGSRPDTVIVENEPIESTIRVPFTL
jgi:hypothetical protein